MIVSDASALIKLALHEPESEIVFNKFKSFIKQGERISSPDIALAESLNAIWKHHVLLKDVSRHDLQTALEITREVWSKIEKIQSEYISEDAMNIAVQYKASVYDSLYIAACRLTSGKLFTFDSKLKQIADSGGITTV